MQRLRRWWNANPWWTRGYEGLLLFLWVAMLLTLPLESSPLLPRVLGGRAVVRPLALLPMMGLFFLEALPWVWRLPWPRAFPALLTFWVVALVASFHGLLLQPMPEQGFTPPVRVVRGFMTLAIGSSFYLVTWVHLRRHPQYLRLTVAVLYLALALVLVWSSLQALYIVRRDEDLYRTLNALQRQWVSTRPLQTGRVSGATYEPSWLATQALILFFPWLWAGLLVGHSPLPRKGRVMAEAPLLLGLAGMLLFTFSRVGLAVFLTVAGSSLLVYLGVQARRSGRWLQVAAGVLGLVAFATLALWGIWRWNAYVFSHFERLWKRMQRAGQRASPDLVLRTLAGSRWAEWQYGFAVYQEHPLLGVGLGLLPFYLDTHVPSGELSTWFIESLLPGGKGEPMMHTRNLYIRLLAETGLVGLWVFLAFQLAVLGAALQLALSPDPEARWAGWAGMIAMAAIFLLAIGFDSLALPHHWVVYGLLSGYASSRAGPSPT